MELQSASLLTTHPSIRADTSSLPHGTGLALETARASEVLADQATIIASSLKNGNKIGY